MSPDVLSCKLSPKTLVRKMKREAAGFRKMVHVAWVLAAGAVRGRSPGRVARVCIPGGSACPEFDLLYKFMRVHGYKNHGLALAEFDGPTIGSYYRGVVAISPKKKGQVILELPASAALSVKTLSAGPNTPAVRVLSRIERRLPPTLFVALLLLYERFEARDASSFSGYISTLPQRIHSLITCDDNSLQELQCGGGAAASCPGLSTILGHRRSILGLLDRAANTLPRVFDKVVFSRETLSVGNLTWAYAVVASRGFTSHKDEASEKEGGGRDGDASADYRTRQVKLIPFADMFNHHNSDPPLYRSYATRADGSLVIFADRDYEAGDEVRISYGRLSNAELLLTYGFVLPNNQYETVEFAVDGSISARVSIDGVVPETLITALTPGTGGPEGRFKALIAITTRIVSVLKTYQTSLAADSIILRSAAVNFCQKAFVQHRVEAKRILHSALLGAYRAMLTIFESIAPPLQSASPRWIAWYRRAAEWESHYLLWRLELEALAPIDSV